jgi:hypothetical protein
MAKTPERVPPPDPPDDAPLQRGPGVEEPPEQEQEPAVPEREPDRPHEPQVVEGG